MSEAGQMEKLVSAINAMPPIMFGDIIFLHSRNVNFMKV